MPSFRRRASVVNADGVGRPRETDRSATAAEALALAEEAEAEAAEADAVAAAVRARARAIRLRRQAQTAATEETAEATPTATDIEDTDEARVDETGTEAGTAAVAGGEDEPQESAEPTPARQRLRSRLRFSRGPVLKALAATVGIACTVALITLSVLMVISHRHQADEAARRAEFTAAGRQSVVTLMSLDFNKAKDDVQRIIDNSTGQFHDDFKNQADDFIKVTQESKVITEVTVNATAVEQMTNDSATVLVSATSHVSNSAGAKQEPRSWRLSVILQRDGGQIKMARVEFVP
ncbi:MAG: hypothetical protein NVSMB60_07320 [Mycobacterium sp.]